MDGRYRPPPSSSQKISARSSSRCSSLPLQSFLLASEVVRDEAARLPTMSGLAGRSVGRSLGRSIIRSVVLGNELRTGCARHVHTTKERQIHLTCGRSVGRSLVDRGVAPCMQMLHSRVDRASGDNIQLDRPSDGALWICSSGSRPPSHPSYAIPIDTGCAHARSATNMVLGVPTYLPSYLRAA